MSALERIACFRGRRDEVPNQGLAPALARTRDRTGIKEIAENLRHKNKSVRSDCLKVLHEIGYIEPAIIAGHVDDFLELLGDKDNRMVWGAMIALACVADKRAKEVWPRIDDIIRITDGGTVITVVWGIRTMARVAAATLAIVPSCSRSCCAICGDASRAISRRTPKACAARLGLATEPNSCRS